MFLHKLSVCHAVSSFPVCLLLLSAELSCELDSSFPDRTTAGETSQIFADQRESDMLEGHCIPSLRRGKAYRLPIMDVYQIQHWRRMARKESLDSSISEVYIS